MRTADTKAIARNRFWMDKIAPEELPWGGGPRQPLMCNTIQMSKCKWLTSLKVSAAVNGSQLWKADDRDWLLAVPGSSIGKLFTSTKIGRSFKLSKRGKKETRLINSVIHSLCQVGFSLTCSGSPLRKKKKKKSGPQPRCSSFIAQLGQQALYEWHLCQ